MIAAVSTKASSCAGRRLREDASGSGRSGSQPHPRRPDTRRGGGYLAQAVLHKGDVSGVNIESIVIAVVGAIIVMFVWRALRGSSRRS